MRYFPRSDVAILIGFGCRIASRQITHHCGIHLDSKKRHWIGLGLLTAALLLVTWIKWQTFVLLVIGGGISIYGPDIREMLTGKKKGESAS